MEGMSHAASATMVGAGVGEGEPRLPESFSFAWLEALIAEHTQGNDDPLTTKLDRFAVAGAILFGALGVLGALLLRNQLGLRILQIGVVLECLCMATLLANAGWQAWLGYRHQYETFARELDQQLVQYNVVVDAVCRYPLHVIAAQLRYVSDRKSRFIYRHGLLSGGIDKLGILPLLLAMYLQFKDWSFGDWKGMLDHIHWIGAFLLTMLLATYLVSWWGVRAKGRLDLYEMVLTEASIRSGDAF
ncbi:hypothetical protein GCM10007862_17560 [Dyella lipolytica]|uniref:Intracellular septation protein A n=1 Tax=Dyella lipolytica TaxID=1867835 RepID=A0ABW8IUG2_9GAMM|nr:hypothetical protein [Dyella lipolytica]GLQ46705.1 hypothetical protein GCM10007862_17560 [Dyella lipolytica]